MYIRDTVSVSHLDSVYNTAIVKDDNHEGQSGEWASSELHQFEESRVRYRSPMPYALQSTVLRLDIHDIVQHLEPRQNIQPNGVGVFYVASARRRRHTRRLRIPVRREGGRASV